MLFVAGAKVEHMLWMVLVLRLLFVPGCSWLLSGRPLGETRRRMCAIRRARRTASAAILFTLARMKEYQRDRVKANFYSPDRRRMH